MFNRVFLTMTLVMFLAAAWALAQDGKSATDFSTIFPATTSAPTVPLDAATTVLPCYELPADSVADCNLEKWRGVPPAVSAEWFKHNESNAMITPSDEFSPAVYFGRVKGTDDLMVLVIVKDRCVFGYESAAWTFGDNVEMFFDFYRQARLAADPAIATQPARYQSSTEPYNNPAAYGQIGLLPRTPLGPGRLLHSRTYERTSSPNWNITYASTLVVGGVAYEVKIDGQATCKALGLDGLPEIVSIEPVIQAVDYPLLLETGAWKNHRGYFRVFGDYTTTAFPLRNGAMSTQPLPPLKNDDLPAVTLASKYGNTVEEIKKQLDLFKSSFVQWASGYPARRDGELFYWAACNGMQLDMHDLDGYMPRKNYGKPYSDAILGGEADARRARELIAQAMLSPSQDVTMRRAMATVITAYPQHNTPAALVAACLIAAELKSGDPDKLVALLSHDDLTVAISAARALAVVGKQEHAVAFRKLYDEKFAALTASKKPDDRATLAAVRIFLQSPLELLEFRVDPPPAPTVVLERKIQPDNTDLPRLMPNDNNHVYNGKLTRHWPDGGPKELWRAKIGIEGVTAAAVEADGRTFVMGVEDIQTPAADGKGVSTTFVQYAYGFNAADGKPLWKVPIGTGRPTYGTASSPIVDDGRVYFFPMSGTVCLNVSDGSDVWRSDAYRTPTFPSPILVGDALYIPGRSLWAVNKMDGTERWTSPSDPKDRRAHSLASPAYTEIDGVPVLVSGFGNGGDAELVGVNPADGELFFRKPIPMSWGLCSSPVIVGSRVYVCSGQSGQELFACYQLFAKDGKVLAMPVFTRTDRQSNYSATLAVWRGVVYGFGNAGLEACSATTGELIWSAKPPGIGGPELVTHLIVADDLLLIRAGQTIILAEAGASTRGYSELARFDVPVKLAVQQHTLANGRLYLRGEDTLIVYAIGADSFDRDLEAATMLPLHHGDLASWQIAFDKISAVIERFPDDPRLPLAKLQRFDLLKREDTGNRLDRAAASIAELAADIDVATPMGEVSPMPFRPRSYGNLLDALEEAKEKITSPE